MEIEETPARPLRQGGSPPRRTPLHKAAWRGNAGAVATLLRRGVDVDAVEPRTAATPLHLAAARGAAPVVEVLARAGADVNRPDADGLAPVHLAAWAGSAPAVAALLAAGADPWLRRGGGGPGGQSGETARQVAERKGHAEVAELLRHTEVRAAGEASGDVGPVPAFSSGAPCHAAPGGGAAAGKKETSGIDACASQLSRGALPGIQLPLITHSAFASPAWCAGGCCTARCNHCLSHGAP